MGVIGKGLRAEDGADAEQASPVVYTTSLGAYLVTREYSSGTGGYAYVIKPSVLARSCHHREGIVDEADAVRLAQSFEDLEIEAEARRFTPDA